MKKIIIINGPNLNLLGKREPKTYGNKSFDSYFKELEVDFPEMKLTSFQSNIEGEIINKIQQTGFSLDGIVLNAGGYTHTSVAIADAIAAIKTPVIEVHISNVYAREEYRHQSLMAKHCKGVIAGFGLDSYKMAINFFLK
jgi:3-dehydroquinate dehydratase-2